ncbi:MAG: dTMP kinase [Gammaproteobacteria bacterium RIFCSPLOWO2_01_FULL_47_190]|nr:MAG: dTMP kinase [Gammaproteobacteria bacterium RIFCSPLOWO2_01_FULL_47_190]OGT83413.1 MAG: dTMP kinase [Gammaproteobacteria bacterium RIFCSPLOWO2_12_FULL_47_76]
MKNNNGLFITLEGIEGAGKSTQVSFIADLLKEAGKDVVITREPGSTELGDQIRNILLMQKTLSISGNAELLLMFAARAQHLEQVIRPALNAGKTVLCDRFTDSTYAYQGGGRGIEQEKISKLVELVHPDLQPDLTLLFDLPVKTGLARVRSAGEADRFESETIGFFDSVRSAYLRIAVAEPGRIKIINAESDVNTVQDMIKKIMKESGLC